MALKNVMRVDGGHVVTGGGAGESSVEIDWEDWCELTPEEQETGDWTIINCPWADGNVSVDLMTKLWENPDPTQAMAADTDINVNTAGYDFIVVLSEYSINYPQYVQSFITKQGNGVTLCQSNLYGTRSVARNFNYVNDNKYRAAAAYDAGTLSADVAIPLAIYGIKLTATVKINAIAMDVKASVEYSTSERLIGKWIDGSDLYEKTIDFGALPNATVKEISSGLSNVTVRDIKGYAKSDNNTICLPFADVPGSSSIYPFYTYADNKLKISSNKNQSLYTECYVTLRYTKNS